MRSCSGLFGWRHADGLAVPAGGDDGVGLMNSSPSRLKIRSDLPLAGARRGRPGPRLLTAAALRTSRPPPTRQRPSLRAARLGYPSSRNLSRCVRQGLAAADRHPRAGVACAETLQAMTDELAPDDGLRGGGLSSLRLKRALSMPPETPICHRYAGCGRRALAMRPASAATLMTPAGPACPIDYGSFEKPSRIPGRRRRRRC